MDGIEYSLHETDVHFYPNVGRRLQVYSMPTNLIIIQSTLLSSGRLWAPNYTDNRVSATSQPNPFCSKTGIFTMSGKPPLTHHNTVRLYTADYQYQSILEDVYLLSTRTTQQWYRQKLDMRRRRTCSCKALCSTTLGVCIELHYIHAQYHQDNASSVCVCERERGREGGREREMMMMIAFITIKSSLVPLIEGLCAQINFRFETSVVCSHLLLFFFVKEKTC